MTNVLAKGCIGLGAPRRRWLRVGAFLACMGLRAVCTPTAHGHNFRLISFVPTARHPEEHVKFQTTCSQAELLALRDLINEALETSSHSSTSEPLTP